MTTPIEHTEDGRHIIVAGRKWRATDPDIPASLRTELVKELMSARRGVKHAKGDPAATATARGRVSDAKVALGERGEPWWEPASDEGRRNRIRAAIRALLRARGEASSICPSEAARIVASPDWRTIMDTVRSVAIDMASEGHIEVTRHGHLVADPEHTAGPVRYRLPAVPSA